MLSGFAGRETDSLIPFHPDTHTNKQQPQVVRTIMLNGEPWWVLADVCKVLEIGNAPMAARGLDDDEKGGISITDSIGRTQTVTTINESGLYSIILKSRKPAAKRFKKWVTSEVLPAIRKTGGYMVASLI
ncbi:BRO-N domain-containing protein [Acetobacter senegalensis]|uniref:BRO-N domain-containing protein n=1 Tax=Acetobacter senegalensis TaxID=446692 RepID=UPI0038D08E22